MNYNKKTTQITWKDKNKQLFLETILKNSKQTSQNQNYKHFILSSVSRQCSRIFFSTFTAKIDKLHMDYTKADNLRCINTHWAE